MPVMWRLQELCLNISNKPQGEDEAANAGPVVVSPPILLLGCDIPSLFSRYLAASGLVMECLKIMVSMT